MSQTTDNRVAVAVSGGGRSLSNLLKAQERYRYQICAVVASRPDCPAIIIAKEHGLPVFAGDFTPAAAASTAKSMFQWLDRDVRANWLALAGFLKLLPVVSTWDGRVINIHPALLPKFGGKGMYGLRVHEAVFRAGERWSGATVHFVSPEYDAGSIIAQIKVPVDDCASPDDIAGKVFAAECQMYPQVLDSLIAGDLPLGAKQVKEYVLNNNL